MRLKIFKVIITIHSWRIGPWISMLPGWRIKWNSISRSNLSLVPVMNWYIQRILRIKIYNWHDIYYKIDSWSYWPMVSMVLGPKLKPAWDGPIQPWNNNIVRILYFGRNGLKLETIIHFPSLVCQWTSLPSSGRTESMGCQIHSISILIQMALESQIARIEIVFIDILFLCM